MTIAMPSAPGFKNRSWGLMSNTQIFESPLSKVVQRLRLTGERWMGTWRMRPMGGKDGHSDRELVANWEVFFAELEGRANSFYAGPPFRSKMRGTILGGNTPVVNGASQVGSTINTTGWAVGQLIPKGTYLQFNTTKQLILTTAAVTAAGSGAASLSIKPQLRTSPANGETIVFTNPVVPMLLATDDAFWNADEFGKFEFEFSGIEVFGG